MTFSFNSDRTVLGTVFTNAGAEEFALNEIDRTKHLLAIGKTGKGKTTMLSNIALQDINSGRGAAIIDPHGDLSRTLLEQFPSSRTADLVYIDPADEERIVTFNVLASVPTNMIAAAASAIVGAWRALWMDSWGYRMERLLYNATAALIEAPNTSLLGLPRLLKSENYRHDILASVNDPIVQDFFTTEYELWRDEYRMTVAEPVLNKIETLLGSPFVRATLGSVASSIDFADIMDNQKILIANLSKGTLGPGHAHLLGAMLVSGFANAAMARAANSAVAPEARVPFYLIVDEFQNFASENFSEILSELRKQKLGLTIGHQYLEQVPDRLRAAVLGNVGSIIAFEVGGSDGEMIAREIGLKNVDALTDQADGEAWAKHATYGGPYHPRLLTAIDTNAGGRDAALKQNRLRNTFPRVRVDEKIARFLAPARYSSNIVD